MKKQRRKKLDSGDIFEMMVEAQYPALDEAEEAAIEAKQEGGLMPIISINGKDVRWHELDFGPEKKDKAA